MKTAVFAILLVAGTAFAAVDPSLAKVQALAHGQFSQDLQRHIYMTAEGVCGAEGPSYIVELRVRHWAKGDLDPQTGMPKLNPVWQTVKTYGIPAAQVNDRDARLMDSETCLE